MKGQGGGGTARGGGKNRSGGGTVKITKTKARKTAALDATILKLRSALFDESGKDKNVLEGIAPSFLYYQRNGVHINVVFSPRLTEEEVDWAFEITRENMEEKYDASGYGWDDDDKERELTEDGARFLLLKDATDDDKVIGYAHFRFTVQGEVIDQMAGDSCLFLVDLHIEEEFQRKGLGKHVMVLLELIARREKMSRVSLPLYLGDADTRAWIGKQKNYVTDESCAAFGFDAEMEGFEVYSKVFTPPSSSGAKPSVTTTTPVSAAGKVEELATVFSKVAMAAESLSTPTDSVTAELSPSSSSPSQEAAAIDDVLAQSQNNISQA